jgi:hypothetical protein
MAYNRNSDKLRMDDLSKSDIIRKIARLKGTSVADAKANIALRTKMKKELIKKGLTSAEWTVAANNMYLNLVNEHGRSYDKIFKDWNTWLGKAKG